MSKIFSPILGLIVAVALCVLAFSQNHSVDKPNVSEKTRHAAEAPPRSHSYKMPNNEMQSETGPKAEIGEALRTKPVQEVDTVRSLGSLASPPGMDYGKDVLVRPPR